MSTNIPATCKTLVQDGKGIILKETPIPEIYENEVLVRVRAIGLNPIDVSTHRLFPTHGAYIGCDFAGEVVKLGPNLKIDIRIGDGVSASVAGNSVSGRGAFAEYAKVFSDLLWKIPEEEYSSGFGLFSDSSFGLFSDEFDSFPVYSFEQAVATGAPLNTAFQALHGVHELGLTQRFDSVPSTGTDETWIFIYGGSSGVGQFAIQLAKLSGYKVVSVASPRNYQFLRTLGTDAVFDYRDPDMVQKVRDATGNKISHVLDTISGNDTQFISVKVMAEDKPGKLVTVLPQASGIQDFRKDVKVMMVTIFISYGVDYGVKAADEDSRSALSAFLQRVPGLIIEGRLKHIPVKHFDGGLDMVTGDGFDYIAKGQVSAEKVVFAV